MSLYDALLKANEEAQKAAMQEETQPAPPPAAADKPQHKGDKPGTRPSLKVKDNANAVIPRGAPNTDEMMDGTEGEPVAALVNSARQRGVEKAASFIEQAKTARENALLIEEELSKVAAMDDQELVDSGYSEYAVAGRQFGIGLIAGQAKIALEMDEAEMAAGGEDPEIEEIVAVVAEGIAEDIAAELPPEQLEDPAINEEIAETAEAVAAEAVDEMLMEAAQEAEGAAGEMGGEAPPAEGA